MHTRTQSVLCNSRQPHNSRLAAMAFSCVYDTICTHWFIYVYEPNRYVLFSRCSLLFRIETESHKMHSVYEEISCLFNSFSILLDFKSQLNCYYCWFGGNWASTNILESKKHAHTASRTAIRTRLAMQINNEIRSDTIKEKWTELRVKRAHFIISCHRNSILFMFV